MKVPRTRPAISAEARSKAVMEMQLRLEQGDPPDDVIAFLIARGLPALDARDLVENVVTEARNDNRRRGLTHLGIGLLCLAVVGPVLYGALSADLPAGVRVRGFGSALSMVGLLGVAGGYLVYRGLVYLSRGHRSTH